jgi:hypothetical protein
LGSLKIAVQEENSKVKVVLSILMLDLEVLLFCAGRLLVWDLAVAGCIRCPSGPSGAGFFPEDTASD